MKKITLISSMVAVLTFSGIAYFTIDSNQHETAVSEVSNDKITNVERVSTYADFAKSYNSIKDLKKNSDLIISGQVLDVQYFDFNTNTFTKSKVQVTRSFNGKVKKGDVINLIEVGGMTTKGNLQKYDPEKVNFPSNQLNDSVEVNIDGAPLSKIGDNIIVFAKEDKEDFYQLGEKAYNILNSYEGKFLVDKVHNKVKRHIEEKDIKDKLEMPLNEMLGQLVSQ
jgi:hypothetical protein